MDSTLNLENKITNILADLFERYEIKVVRLELMKFCLTHSKQ